MSQVHRPFSRRSFFLGSFFRSWYTNDYSTNSVVRRNSANELYSFRYTSEEKFSFEIMSPSRKGNHGTITKMILGRHRRPQTISISTLLHFSSNYILQDSYVGEHEAVTPKSSFGN